MLLERKGKDSEAGLINIGDGLPTSKLAGEEKNTH